MATDSETNRGTDVHAVMYHKVLVMLKRGAVACFVIAMSVILLISPK